MSFSALEPGSLQHMSVGPLTMVKSLVRVSNPAMVSPVVPLDFAGEAFVVRLLVSLEGQRQWSLGVGHPSPG